MPPHGAPAPGGSAPLFGQVTSAALPPDQAQWAQKGGNAPNRPDDPPPWADDPQRWAMARGLVQRSWAAYQEPWAVVARVYGELGEHQAQPPTAGPAVRPPMPPPGAPPGPPRPAMPPPVGAR